MDLLISEILEKVSKIKSKKEKVTFLKQNDSDSLRMVIKSSFDPKMVWLLPEGEVPYQKNEAPEGTEHTNLHTEARKLYHYLEGGNADLTQNKRETMFVQLLEGLHETDAEGLVAAKDKINKVIINIFFNSITPIRGVEMITPVIGNYFYFQVINKYLEKLINYSKKIYLKYLFY